MIYIWNYDTIFGALHIHMLNDIKKYLHFWSHVFSIYFWGIGSDLIHIEIVKII